jgi:hypothetical protein
MTGIINFFREGWFAQVVGKLFYFGGEPLDNGDGDISPHYLNCSNPIFHQIVVMSAKKQRLILMVVS